MSTTNYDAVKSLACDLTEFANVLVAPVGGAIDDAGAVFVGQFRDERFEIASSCDATSGVIRVADIHESGCRVCSREHRLEIV